MLATMSAPAPRMGSPTSAASPVPPARPARRQRGGRRRASAGAGAAPAATGGGGGGRRGSATGGACGRLRAVVREELPPVLADRRRVGPVLLVHLLDEPGVGSEDRSGASSLEPSGSGPSLPIGDRADAVGHRRRWYRLALPGWWCPGTAPVGCRPMTNIRTGGLLISLVAGRAPSALAGVRRRRGGGSGDSVPADALVVEALDIRFDQKEYTRHGRPSCPSPTSARASRSTRSWSTTRATRGRRDLARWHRGRPRSAPFDLAAGHLLADLRHPRPRGRRHDGDAHHQLRLDAWSRSSERIQSTAQNTNAGDDGVAVVLVGPAFSGPGRCPRSRRAR